MKVSFYNIGCKLNFAEISEVQKQFEESGYEVVDFKEKADIVVLNTCTVTNQADKDSRKYIRRAIRNNPNAFITVMGCYSQLKPDEISEIPGVDLILGTNNKFDIQNLITDFKKKDSPQVIIPDLEDVPFHFASSVENNSRTRVVFKIQDGCDYVCSYCTIPKARGKSRSMDFNELKHRLLELNNSDYHEIVLSGINLGEYLDKSGKKFVDVIRYIAESELNYRVRISSIEPNLVTDEIIQLVKQSENLCNHFHIPLQSGSDEILGKMKRRYRTELYRDLINKIKVEIPNCGIGADVIEGFPSESNNNFKETVDFINELPISYLHVFSYSDREFTESTEFENHIPNRIIKERTNTLRQISDDKKEKFIKSEVGKSHIMIPETAIEKSTGIVNKGWTDNYIPVILSDNEILNKPTKIRIDKIENGVAEVSKIKD